VIGVLLRICLDEFVQAVIILYVASLTRQDVYDQMAQRSLLSAGILHLNSCLPG
jgi:hypothetical protein